jgi:hypothetical protein
MSEPLVLFYPILNLCPSACKKADYGAATLHGIEIPCFYTSPAVRIDNVNY